MKCPRCWNDVPPYSAYCLHCGHELAATQVTPRSVTPIPQPQQERPQGWTPGMIVLIVVAIVAGVVGSVALIAGAMLRRSPQQQVRPAPAPNSPTPRTVVIYATPSPSATPSPPPAVEVAPQPSKTSRIKFGRGGTTSTVQGTKTTFDFHDYYIRALAGQTMNVQLSASEDISFQVLNSTGDQILTRGMQQNWEGVLPYTGDYIIRILGPAGFYTLSVTAYPL